MNKLKSVLFQVVLGLTLLMSFLFVGCTEKVEGTYKFKSLSYQESGMTIELVAGEKFMGMMTLSEDFATITLNEDGSAVMVIEADGLETSTGTWSKIDDEKIALTFDGEAQTVDCDGKTVSIEVDGAKLVLEKKN